MGESRKSRKRENNSIEKIEQECEKKIAKSGLCFCGMCAILLSKITKEALINKMAAIE